MTELDISTTAPDAAIENRPGYPMEREPAPLANAHWLTPDKQPQKRGILMDPSRRELTATFGTRHPPRGISGLVRRAAYEIPDYRAKRWLLLILADRIDAVEARLIRTAKHPATWAAAAGIAAILLAVRGQRRSRFAWR